MGFDTTLARYRMTIALGVALFGPTAAGVLFGATGIATTTQLTAVTQVVVWIVGLWAIGSAVWECARGVSRYRSAGDAETADTAATP